MKLLVDSHSFLWAARGDRRLSPVARDAMLDVNNERFLSAATIWELAIKHAAGRLPDIPPDFAGFISDHTRYLVLNHLSVQPSHAFVAGLLPLHHRDPFDRMLVAQAQVEGMVLVTRDDAIIRRYDVQTLW